MYENVLSVVSSAVACGHTQCTDRWAVVRANNLCWALAARFAVTGHIRLRCFALPTDTAVQDRHCVQTAGDSAAQYGCVQLTAPEEMCSINCHLLRLYQEHG